MKTIGIAVAYALVAGFAAGTVVAGVKATATSNDNVYTSDVAAPDAPAIDIAGVMPGDYQISVFAVDASGALIGTPVAAVFTVTGDVPATISLSLPSSVTVSQSA